jgi:membrane-associated phospholipid phosphatase
MIVLGERLHSGEPNVTDTRQGDVPVLGAPDEMGKQWRPFLAKVSGLAMLSGLGLAATAYAALRTSQGQQVDLAARDALSSPPDVLSRLYEGLGWVSPQLVGFSLLVCIALAVLRDRFDLALGALVIIAGANITTQILKRSVFPDLKLSPGANGLPSGHTTAAMSIALAAVLVAPPVWRSMVAVGVYLTATLVGVALVLGRYHRPSDVLAAAFVCLGWAALGLLAAHGARRRRPVAGHAAQRALRADQSLAADQSRAGGESHLLDRAPAPSLRLGVLLALVVGGLLLRWGVRPEPAPKDLWLGIISLGSIGLACAVSIAAVARMTQRHLG